MGFPPKINHPQPTTFAFASLRISVPDFAQATRSHDHITGLGCLEHFILQASVRLIAQVFLSVAFESWQLNKERFHRAKLYASYVRNQAGFFEP